VALVASFSFYSCTLAPRLDAGIPETFKQYDAFIKEHAPDEDAFVEVQLAAKPYIK
jgi:hypothetical protein